MVDTYSQSCTFEVVNGFINIHFVKSYTFLIFQLQDKISYASLDQTISLLLGTLINCIVVIV
jgi:hypothetical protein